MKGMQSSNNEAEYTSFTLLCQEQGKKNKNAAMTKSSGMLLYSISLTKTLICHRDPARHVVQESGREVRLGHSKGA
jgi:hypothetical protein